MSLVPCGERNSLSYTCLRGKLLVPTYPLDRGNIDMLAGMRTIWGIHNDRKEIDTAQDKAVRIGWDEIGDLSELEPSRVDFKSDLAQERHEAGVGEYTVCDGKLIILFQKI